MKGSRCDSMLGAEPAPPPESAGAAADEPAGAAVVLLAGAALDEVSGEDPEGDDGGVAPPPQAGSRTRAQRTLRRRMVARPYHACAGTSSPRQRGGVAKRLSRSRGNGLAESRVWSSRTFQSSPRWAKKATPMTPTFRASPVWAA